jgi:hypothetical protein
MTVLYPRPTHSLRSFLEDCLLPTNRVRISAEWDRRARLKSSVSTVSASLWNNCSGVDYRRSVTPTADITV